ncbi:MAG: hypothetical protein HC806_00410 [Anaerolineae bacterium]|nr:hypothetical protein [Anaerolineae bacterium]
MAAILYPIYTLAHLWLFLRLLRLRRRADGRMVGALILQVVILGLIYDSLIISIGRWLGEGELLLRLNEGRFLVHAVFTPLLMVTTLYFANRGEVQIAKNRFSVVVVWLAGFSLIGFGLVTEFVLQSDFIPSEFMGTLRYVHANSILPFPSILTIIVIVILGALIWRKMKWPWVFLGGLVMFIGSAVPTSIVGPVVGSGVEVFLIGCLVATEQRLLTPDYSMSEGELDSRISQVSAERK